jgi:hypothetical protein
MAVTRPRVAAMPFPKRHLAAIGLPTLAFA